MGPGFALTIILMTAILTVGSVLRHWIKASRPLPVGDDRAGARHIELLAHENAGLKGQVGRLEERIAVLERIATDPAIRTVHEIESLR